MAGQIEYVGDDGIAWVRERTSGDGVAGFNAAGWEAETWILNAMYEIDIPTDLSHDDLLRRRLALGLESPMMFGDFNLDECTTEVGVTLGWADAPGDPWKRVRWADLAQRLGVQLGESDVPPCHRWWPYRSWPANTEPPNEGSLDAVSLRELVQVLSMQGDGGPDTPCVGYWSPLVTGDYDRDTVYRFPLSAVPLELMREQVTDVASPSNFWPEDRSWFVYTDWDLWATKVSGSAALIAAIEASSELETLSWP